MTLLENLSSGEPKLIPTALQCWWCGCLLLHGARLGWRGQLWCDGVPVLCAPWRRTWRRSSPLQMRWGSPGLWAASPTSAAIFWHIKGFNCPLPECLAHPRASSNVPLLGQWLTVEQLSFRGATEPEPSTPSHTVLADNQF